jgi:predicted membrane protein
MHVPHTQLQLLHLFDALFILSIWSNHLWFFWLILVGLCLATYEYSYSCMLSHSIYLKYLFPFLHLRLCLPLSVSAFLIQTNGWVFFVYYACLSFLKEQMRPWTFRSSFNRTSVSTSCILSDLEFTSSGRTGLWQGDKVEVLFLTTGLGVIAQ